MSVRAASFVVVVGAVLLGASWGAGAAGVPVAGAPVDASNDFPVASEVRLGGDETQTRMVVDFSQKIELRAFTLANPYRVIIDLPQVVFRLPPKTGESGRGLVKAFRYGLMMTGGSRIVIDLARPARVEKNFVLDASNEQPARLVLDLAAVAFQHMHRRHHDVFERGLVRKQIILLEHHADLAAQCELVELGIVHLLALDQDRSLVDRHQRVDAAQQRRLA